MSRSSSNKSVSLATANNWKKRIPWLIVDLENNLSSGLLCEVCFQYEDKLKGLRGYDAKLFHKVQNQSSRCFVKKVFLETS